MNVNTEGRAKYNDALRNYKQSRYGSSPATDAMDRIEMAIFDTGTQSQEQRHHENDSLPLGQSNAPGGLGVTTDLQAVEIVIEEVATKQQE